VASTLTRGPRADVRAGGGVVILGAVVGPVAADGAVVVVAALTEVAGSAAGVEPAGAWSGASAPHPASPTAAIRATSNELGMQCGPNPGLRVTARTGARSARAGPPRPARPATDAFCVTLTKSYLHNVTQNAERPQR